MRFWCWCAVFFYLLAKWCAFVQIKKSYLIYRKSYCVHMCCDMCGTMVLHSTCILFPELVSLSSWGHIAIFLTQNSSLEVIAWTPQKKFGIDLLVPALTLKMHNPGLNLSFCSLWVWPAHFISICLRQHTAQFFSYQKLNVPVNSTM